MCTLKAHFRMGGSQSCVGSLIPRLRTRPSPSAAPFGVLWCPTLLTHTLACKQANGQGTHTMPVSVRAAVQSTGPWAPATTGGGIATYSRARDVRPVGVIRLAVGTLGRYAGRPVPPHQGWPSELTSPSKLC